MATPDRMERRGKLSRPAPKAKLSSPYSKPKSNLSPKSSQSVTAAQVQKMIADAITKIPGVQNTKSAANVKLRETATRNVRKAKAAQAAKTGKSARAQMAETRARRKK